MQDPNSVIKTIMSDKGVTQADLAKLFGVSSQAINNKFRRGSWDFSEVVKILDFMDCNLIAVTGDIRMYQF